MYTPHQAYYNSHPQFPYNAYDYPTQASFASQQPEEDHVERGPNALYYSYGYDSRAQGQSTQASTSSLAYALDENVAVRHLTPPAQGFPTSEVVPYAPSPSSMYGGLSPPHHQYYAPDDEGEGYGQMLHARGVRTDVISDDEGKPDADFSAQCTASDA